MTPEIIITERLKLLKVTPDIFAYLFKNLSEQEAMAFLGYHDMVDLHRDRERYQGGMSTFNKKFLYFHLIEKASNISIGWCGFHTWYLDHKRAEIGYGLMEDVHKNQGLMREAIKPIVEYGFTQMDLHRIEAFISPNNIPSLKLVQALGFQQEGLLREHYRNHGKMENSAVFSLLRDEYKNG